MSKWRKAARVDLNQPGIVKQLRDMGYSVETGKDDILVGVSNKTFWYEIKELHCVSKKTGKILDSEKKKHQKVLEAGWQGHYKIVSSWQEIVDDIKKHNR